MGIRALLCCSQAKGSGGSVGAKEWQVHSMRVRDDLNVSAGFAPWTSREDVVHCKSFPPRHKDVLDCAWISHTRACRQQAKAAGVPAPSADEMKVGFFTDVGQAVQRKPWSSQCMRCLCSNSLVYSHEADGIITPRQHLQLQGLPKASNFSSISETSIRDLAGEGFFAGCIGSVLWAAILEGVAPWWKSGEA